jgi:hypothetical protein
MINSSGTVIGESGVEFGVEVAEPKAFAINANSGEPFSFTFAERYAAIAGVSV